MSKKQKLYAGKIPFNVFGDQLHYPEGGIHELKAENFKEDGVYIQRHFPSEWRKIFFQDKIEKLAEPRAARWSKDGVKDVIATIGDIEIDNYVFEDTLRYDTYSRGRSAGYFHFVSVFDGRGVTVFFTDFNDFILNMNKGAITGKFTFVKRGANYGCKLLS